jgi:cytochrome c oxidase assembly protein subunit 11
MVSRNAITVIALLAIVGGMGGLTAYSAELYSLFCRVTGFGGTTQIADAPAGQVIDRVITVRFNADVNSGLPWRFEPAQGPMRVRLGEPALAFYTARSQAERAITGTATFNVTPAKAGIYFNKIDCFCFTEQTLDAGARAELPVSFFIDPDLAADRGLDDVTTITLSYTFFRAKRQSAAKAFSDLAAPARSPARPPNAMIPQGAKGVAGRGSGPVRIRVSEKRANTIN